MSRIGRMAGLGLLFGTLALLTFAWQPDTLEAQDERPGIDCGCTLVGIYKIPDKGKEPAVVVVSEFEGESPHGTYKYTVGTLGSQITLVVTTADGQQILVQETFTPDGEAHWGFSPDDHRFVYRYYDASGHQWVRLFDLTRPEGSNLIKEYSYAALGFALNFSPLGRYLFYAAMVDLSPTTVHLSLVDTWQEPYDVHETTIQPESAPGDELGLAVWGFSAENQHAVATGDASFLYAWRISQSDVRWRLVNVRDLTAEPWTDVVTSGTHWSYSPCGDLFGVIEGDFKTVRLIHTGDGTVMYSGGYSDTAAQLSCTLQQHKLNENPLIDNTADQTCPDVEAPTWPQGSSLTADGLGPFGLTLHWTQAEDNVAVASYALYQDAALLDTVGASILSYEVSGLSPSTEYTFAVEAGDGSGNESDDGPSLTLSTVAAVPAWPEDKALTASNVGIDSLTLTWTPALSDLVAVTDYQLYSSKQILETLGGDVLSHPVSGLAANTTYTFTVQACHTLDYCSTDGPSAEVTTRGDVLSLTKTDAPDPVLVGFPLTYTLSVANHRPAGASGVVLTDTLPGGVNPVSAVPSQGECTVAGRELECPLGELAGAEPATVTVVVETLEEEVISNSAWVTSTDPDGMPGNNLAAEETIVTSWLLEVLGEGSSPSLAVDSWGRVHLVYVHQAGTLRELRYVTNASGTWTNQVLPGTAGSTVIRCVLAVDSTDVVHVAYATETDLQYTNNRGGSWQPPEHAASKNVGFWSLSMAVDRAGGVHVSYMDARGPASVGYLRYASQASGEWVVWAVTSQKAYDHASMALDSTGRAHISFYSFAVGGLAYMRQDSQGLWGTPERVEWVGGQLEGMGTSIAIDATDRPHISYLGGPMEDIRHATLEAGSWVTETVDVGDFTGYGSAIAVDPVGGVHILYWHELSDQLRYATDASGAWVIKAVDWQGANLQLVIDGLGIPNIAYVRSGPWTVRGPVVYGTKDVPPLQDTLRLAKAGTPGPVLVGAQVTYELTVTSHYPEGATSVVLTDVLPSGVHLVSAVATQGSCDGAQGEVVCTLGDLAWGECVTVSLLVEPLQEGWIENTAVVTSVEEDVVPLNNHATARTLVTAWVLEPIGEGLFPYVDVDSENHAHIAQAYWGETLGEDEMRYVTNASGSWVTQQIPVSDTAWVQYGPIAVDSSDRVHVSYYQSEPGTSLDVLKYTYKDDGPWQSPQVVTTSAAGLRSPSMAIDAGGHVHIGYIAALWSAGPLRLASNESGTWVTSTLAPGIDAVHSASLALDANGHTHVGFYSPDVGGLAYITDAPDGTWGAPQLVDPIGDLSQYLQTDIAIDSLNRPHLSYVGGSLADIRYATLSGAAWVTRTLDHGNRSGATHAIAVDAADQVHLAYYRQSDTRELRYVTNAQGSWRTETVDAGGATWKVWSVDLAIDAGAAPRLVYEEARSDYADSYVTYATRPSPDSDEDGVPDREESGPSGDDPSYDGNGDGIPDREQEYVASFHTYGGERYVTLAVPEGAKLAGVEARPNPSPGDAPAGVSFPCQFLAFTVEGVEAGGAVTATLALPAGVTVEGYYKYGPTPDTPLDHWYAFAYDGETGAEIGVGAVTLHLVDGKRGDGDLLADTRIVEPGGPAAPMRTLYLPLIVRKD
jgi:uncharacterized repeat protein (TIGR01451 family)